jgi:hypothetical protein
MTVRRVVSETHPTGREGQAMIAEFGDFCLWMVVMDELRRQQPTAD